MLTAVKGVFGRTLDILLEIIFPISSEARNLRGVSLESLRKLVFSRKVYGIDVIFSYKNPLIRKMIWEMKFRGDLHVTKFLAHALAERICDSLPFSEFLIIPIPASAERLRERGFNQCELLAKEMMSIFKNMPIDGRFADFKFILKTNILFKRRFSNQQKKKNRKGRIDEITDTFIVRNISNVAGSNIILIDDVVTTGSTLNEARRALMIAGAGGVTCFGLAH